MFFNNQNKEYLDFLSAGLPVDSRKYWWVRYPKRAVKELEKIYNNTNATLSRDGSQLKWKENIENNFGSYFSIEIITDSKYPFVMPKVFVTYPYISPSHDKHMFNDGSLCLMHKSEYRSNLSILEIRNQACAWCFCYTAYKETDVWPAAEYKH